MHHGLLGLGLVIVALAGLERPIAQLGPPLACGRAQLIDGRLRCDAELIGDLRELCGGPSRPLAPGDQIDAACTRDELVRRMPPDQLAALAQRVDVNTAAIDELASLPGIGPTIAARIVAGRPYEHVDELLEVRGIGPKRLVGLRDRARVGAALTHPDR